MAKNRELIKVSMNFPRDELVALRQFSVRRRTTMTDVVRRAIELERLLDEEIARGGRLVIETVDGKRRELMVRR